MGFICWSSRIRLKGLFIVLLLTHSLPLTVHGCILLLNGWEPLSLAERTSLAPVVAAAFVRRTFRAVRTDIDTFTAEVSLLDIYKGEHLVKNLTGVYDSKIKDLYNVSNFGDEVMCYSNVQEGESYILFMTNFEGQLSAKYDDIFGAAADFNDKNQAQILQSLDIKTFSAEVRFLEVYKGKYLIQNITQFEGQSINDLYNVSNFGEAVMCYSNVQEGESYILFMTNFEGQLSAKYDDIFGAAAEYNKKNDAQVLEAVGWKPWSTWSACSTSCGGGIQTRRRNCTKKTVEECEGLPGEQRLCNTYDCKGTKDLLEVLEVRGLPLGVTLVEERPAAFRIDPSAELHAPLSSVFRRRLPKNFSVLTAIRPKANNAGFLLTISDIDGTVKLAIQVGSNPTFQYSNSSTNSSVLHSSVPATLSGISDKNSDISGRTVRFPVELSDGDWHYIGYSVEGSTITMYKDCDLAITKQLRKAKRPKTGPNSVITLGKSLKKNELYPHYEGDIELLIMVADSTAASKVCDSRTGPIIADGMNGDGTFPLLTTTTSPASTPTLTLPTSTTTGSSQHGITWSSWSECSATCGRGLQSRTAFCGNNQISLDSCNGDSDWLVQNRPCILMSCPVSCDPVCKNGGQCTEDGFCACPSGFYGDHCQQVSCYPNCMNGGTCVGANQCECAEGWSGPSCNEATCDPPCSPGGRCIKPGVCSCPYGTVPPHCTPICTPVCEHGDCIGYGICRCSDGWTGSRCSIALCKGGCMNGGSCIAPDLCSCPHGFHGSDCSQGICDNNCENGGMCSYEDSCFCPENTFGDKCQFFSCSGRCFNGGACASSQHCYCPDGYYGNYCEIPWCPWGCDNGGTCVGPNRCCCTSAYHGRRCHKKKCVYQVERTPHKREHRRLHRENVTYKCGLLALRTCTKVRSVYKTVYRTYYRTSRKCKPIV